MSLLKFTGLPIFGEDAVFVWVNPRRVTHVAPPYKSNLGAEATEIWTGDRYVLVSDPIENVVDRINAALGRPQPVLEYKG